MISVEDRALIRRLGADGVPQRRVARDMGIGWGRVVREVSSEGLPKYQRLAVPETSAFEAALEQWRTTCTVAREASSPSAKKTSGRHGRDRSNG